MGTICGAFLLFLSMYALILAGSWAWEWLHKWAETCGKN